MVRVVSAASAPVESITEDPLKLVSGAFKE